MKKLALSVVMLALVFAMSGCGEKPSNNVQDPETPGENPGASEVVDDPVNQGTSDEKKYAKRLEVLYSQEGLWEYDEQGNMLVDIQWENLALAPACAKDYPQLASVLQKMGVQLDGYMADTKESLVSDVYVYLENADPYVYFGGFTASLDRSVLRADEFILSVRGDSSEYRGGAHPLGGTAGLNLNPATGAELRLEDVVKDVAAVIKKAEGQIGRKYAGQLSGSVDGMLVEWADALAWTMDYEGLTFYINPGDLAPYAMGTLTATIWFDEDPQLFKDEYLLKPAGGYTVELPLYSPISVDVDKSDGFRDTLELYAPEDEMWGIPNIAIVLNGVQKIDPECSGYGFDCRLVCGEHDGATKTYLHVETYSPNGYNEIHVYDLSKGSISKVGILAPAGHRGLWIDESAQDLDFYRVTTFDPGQFELEKWINLLSTVNGAKTYSVDFETGMPVTKDETYDVSIAELTLVSAIPLEVSILPDLSPETIAAGSDLTFLRTDGSTYVDMLLADGRECRIAVEGSSHPLYINGVSEYECFEFLHYAG